MGTLKGKCVANKSTQNLLTSDRWSDAHSSDATKPLPMLAKGQAIETILLVEDEDFVREVTAQVLQSKGYLVLRARNASEAMSIFLENADHVALLLTDVIMPGKTGIELARELRRIRPQTKVVFMSGYPDVPNSEAEIGISYLGKPFSARALIGAIEEMLERELSNDAPESLRRAAGIR